jgi:hypothetical protein
LGETACAGFFCMAAIEVVAIRKAVRRVRDRTP